jgi:hypothetical protein
LGVMETHRLTATSVRREIKIRERFVENVGQVKISITDCVARKS